MNVRIHASWHWLQPPEGLVLIHHLPDTDICREIRRLGICNCFIRCVRFKRDKHPPRRVYSQIDPHSPFIIAHPTLVDFCYYITDERDNLGSILELEVKSSMIGRIKSLTAGDIGLIRGLDGEAKHRDI